MPYNVHPTGSGGFKKQDIPDDQDPRDKDESDYFQCAQCGFWNDRGKITIGDSTDSVEPLIVDETIDVPGGTDQTIKTVDETQQSGCRFCHSHNSDLHFHDRTLGSKSTPRGFGGYR